eukprot:scaffold456_cov73-Cylindrotheca_fusiformis.AAC.5
MRYHLSTLLLLLSSSIQQPVSGFTSIRLPHHHVVVSSKKQQPSTTSTLQAIPFPDLTLAQEVSMNAFHMYENALTQHPITTKAITSGILATIGDAIAQVSAHSSKLKDKDNNNGDVLPFSYDYARAVCFLVFGAAYTGIFQHFWFDYLGNHISQWGESLKLWGPLRAALPVDALYDLNEWWSYFDIVSMMENPPSNTAVAMAKLAVNQFVMIPSVYMPLFFAVTGSLSKLNLEESTERAKNMYIPLLKRNYFYWLPVQFFQFLVIPADYQILFISCASLLWTVILSSIATDQPKQQQTNAGAATAKRSSPTTDAITQATDAITLEDVEKAFIPQAARNILEDPKFGSTTLGGTVGLLASAANDGVLGAFVSNLLGATIGSGIAVVAATGAIIGLLTATTTTTSTDDEKMEEIIDLPEHEMMQLLNGDTIKDADLRKEELEPGSTRYSPLSPSSSGKKPEQQRLDAAEKTTTNLSR